MSINTSNLFMTNQYDVYNNLGYGSGVAALFSGVPGLNSVWNFCGSNYTTGCCNGGSNFNWGSILGMATVMFTGLLAGKGIQSYNTNKANREASEAKAANDFYSALKTLDLKTGEDDILQLTPGDIDNVTIDKNVLAKLHEPVEAAGQKVTELETQKRADTAEWTNVDESLKPNGCTSNDIDTIINDWRKYIDNLTEGQNHTQADAAIKRLEDLKALKKSWEPGGKKAEELEKAEGAKKQAEAKEKEAIEEKQQVIDNAKEIAKKYLNEQQDKINAERAKETNAALDKHDGNAVGRMFTEKHFTVGDDGTITVNGTLTASDLKKLSVLYRNGSNDQRAKIKAFVEENKSDLRKAVQPGSDEEFILNKILNS